MSDDLTPTIRVFPSANELAAHVAELIAHHATLAVHQDRDLTLALSGGSTPQSLFRLLATDAWAGRINWQRVQVLFADERCVPAAHDDSNFGAACRLLLDHVCIPYQNIHRIPGEKDPHLAADQYEDLLASRFADGLDLILLGMGDDGHTASLFPHSQALLAPPGRRCVANFVPTLNAWRLTLTSDYINLGRQVVMMVAGAAKSGTLTRVLKGPAMPDDLPAQRIRPLSRQLTWMLDAAAAGMFDEEMG